MDQYRNDNSNLDKKYILFVQNKILHDIMIRKEPIRKLALDRCGALQ